MITQCSKVFLGQKYGYRPIPTYILASELAQFREILLTMGQEVILLDTWYKKDSNAVPPVCILQPISSILVNFNNKVSLYHTIVQISTTNLRIYTEGSEIATRRPGQMVGHSGQDAEIVTKSSYYALRSGTARFRLDAQLPDVG